jgi:hypothetical protein
MKKETSRIRDDAIIAARKDVISCQHLTALTCLRCSAIY